MALSQVIQNKNEDYWRVPEDQYQAIRQDAVLLLAGEKNRAAKELLKFLKSDKAIKIMKKYGYKQHKAKE